MIMSCVLRTAALQYHVRDDSDPFRLPETESRLCRAAAVRELQKRILDQSPTDDTLSPLAHNCMEI